MSYTHLHFHTDYSLLDGANKIKNIAKKVKELGMSSVAITDHGNMFGAIDFYQAMSKEGIKPIIGVEAYVTNHDFGVRKKGMFHICLYAKDEIGYKNLMYLTSKAYENIYYKPRVTKEMLRERSEGLICTSACLAGEINFHLNQSERNIQRGSKGYERAKEVALEYRDIFGEDFYIEIMRHGIGDQFDIDSSLIKLSKETGIELVATNDTHYTNEDDAEAHEVYMAIGTGKTWEDPKRLKHSVHEFFIKSPEEMKHIFLDIPEAIENTNVIADKCNLKLNLGNPTPPNFKFTLEYSKAMGLELPEKDTLFSLKNDGVLFAEQSKRGLQERLKFIPKEDHQKYKERLEHEINTINSMKFPGYMLIVWDFVRYSGENDIPVGPGRGCLTKEAQIYVKDGSNFTQKSIDEVATGDTVITHENQEKEVLEIFKYEIEEELYKIDTFYGDSINPIILTKDHKIYIGDGNWKEAKDISTQDWLYLPIPKSSSNLSREKNLDILSGYFSSNTFTTDSKKLVYQTRRLLFQVGIPSSIHIEKRERNSIYILKIPANSVFETPKEQKDIYKIEDDFIKLKVRRVERVPKSKREVFDFSVKDDHSYTTTNFIVHNSAAGSLVAFALKITDIDPIKYDLLFERFLNPERISMPDIDMDFAQNKRKEIIHYVQEKYGTENVAQVVTFNSLLPKGVLRDVSRVFDISLKTVNDFVKLIPDELKMTLKKAIERIPQITEFLEEKTELKKVWRISEKLEGLKRNTGIHAAGLVISNEELWNKTPLYVSKEGDFVTQYSLDYLEDVDLIKFDFLGLKTLDVIFSAIQLIRKNHDENIIWQEVDVNDPKVYQDMSSGKTVGIFQIESSGMQELNKRMKPSNFEDIIALIALYRPGPMEAGMLDEFVERKHGRKKIFYPFENKEFPEQLKEILEPTYGMIVYQEQVMQIVQKIGGFSLGKSDIVRRAMGKKKITEMKKYKSEFANGAEDQGLDREVAEGLFDLIEKFAGYGFNKSHSAAYAMLTFQTAYLKTHFPAEFIASLLSTESQNMIKIALYTEEARRMGMEILVPDINRSQKGFSVVKLGEKEAILFGLEGIKGVGENVVETIVSTQKDGPFKNIQDFLNRVKPIKGTLEALFKAGAFDLTKYNRKTLIANIDKIVQFSSEVGKLQKTASNSLFLDDDNFSENTKELSLTPREEYPLDEKLRFEKEVLSLYVSASPLDDYREEISEFKFLSKAKDQDSFKSWQEIVLIGFIEFEEKISKSGNLYAPGKIIDETGEVSFVIFARELEFLKSFDLLKPIGLKAKVLIENESMKFTKKEFFPLEKAREKGENLQKGSSKPVQKQYITEEKAQVFKDKKTYLNLQYFLSKEEIQLLKEMAKDLKGDYKLVLSYWYNQKRFLIETDFYVLMNFYDLFFKRLENRD